MSPPPSSSVVLKNTTNRLAGQTILITGGSSGLGRAMAQEFARNGARHIVVADLTEPPANDEDGPEPTAATLGRFSDKATGSFVRCDVRDADSVRKAVEFAREKGGGRLDVMVNNAGKGPSPEPGRLHDYDDKEWDSMMSINLRGVYLGSKHALAAMVNQERDPSGARGYIINVASVLGHVAFPGIMGGAAAYCASKAGVVNLTRQLALDYARDGIRCNALCPSFIKTPMSKTGYENSEFDAYVRACHPDGQWGDAHDAARVAVFLASPDAAWVNGVGLPVDGGYLAQ